MTDLTAAYVFALTGDINAVLDWRVIHDTNKGEQGHNLRGSLQQVRDQLTAYNQAGWGVFVCINAMDGQGHKMPNVQYIRTHVIDLDDPATSNLSYNQAVSAYPQPHFAVQTSPNKYHVYWKMQPYVGNDFYTLHQKKLRQLYNSDESISDPTRVLRVPGFYHLKNPAQPFLVTCWSLGDHAPWSAQQIEAALQHVNVFNAQSKRVELGEPTLQAPSLDWLKFALTLIDPNELNRDEWMSFSAAVKQAGWSHTDEQTLLGIWLAWCARYEQNDHAENMKMWNSVDQTQIGWPAIKHRTPVQAWITFGHQEPPAPQPAPVPSPVTSSASANTPAYGDVVSQEHTFGEILTEYECQLWFKDCYLIEKDGKVFTSKGRFMNSSQFNAAYGGKQFIITGTGKTTDEPWKAALRSTCWTLPKVDHTRFLPEYPTFHIELDGLKRKGLNTYIPAFIKSAPGDVSLWLDFLSRIFPTQGDIDIFNAYIAHNVKFPGHKIPWSFLFQSEEGVGKQMIGEIIKHCIGMNYVYQPSAKQLVESGSKFNAWMRAKLLIMVDEIRVDERRDLVEVLKPMITDRFIEVQGKGVDQDMEDNPANWLFFTNYKDALPIRRSGRRYCISYSSLQSASEIAAAGLTKEYFDRLYDWLRKDQGFEAIAYWYLNYPIEKGSLPHRAPETSCYKEALKISRSPMEVLIDNAIDDGLPGFRGGFISVQAVINRVKFAGMRTPSAMSVETILKSMDYHELGRTATAIPQEDVNSRSVIYSLNPQADINQYERMQGWK